MIFTDKLSSQTQPYISTHDDPDQTKNTRGRGNGIHTSSRNGFTHNTCELNQKNGSTLNEWCELINRLG